jgi:hypothetical protein
LYENGDDFIGCLARSIIVFTGDPAKGFRAFSNIELTSFLAVPSAIGLFACTSMLATVPIKSSLEMAGPRPIEGINREARLTAGRVSLGGRGLLLSSIYNA